MGVHFELREVPAGHWRRLNGTAEDVPRPHLFPISKTGRVCLRFAKILPEEIPYPVSVVDNGELALRFQWVNPEEVAPLIERASGFAETLVAALKPQPGDPGYVDP